MPLEVSIDGPWFVVASSFGPQLAVIRKPARDRNPKRVGLDADQEQYVVSLIERFNFEHYTSMLQPWVAE